MTENFRQISVDSASQTLLAEDDLRFELLAPDDRDAFGAWLQVISRAFHLPTEPDERIDQLHPYFATMRMSGVWDDLGAASELPVATIRAWPTDLTVPGRTSVPAWAISSVAVAGTHRRRGIARALMEAELRTAEALDIPLAVLTVSESTIYGHFGFGPAALGRDLTIDTGRARWAGHEVSGRVHYVTQEQLLADGHAIVQRVRLETPGQIQYAGILWERLLGVATSTDWALKLRFARYDDADGTPQGFAIFSLAEDGPAFTQHELKLHHLVTATDEAYAGLWRFLLETDLVHKVTADLRPIDEPLRWMVPDFRAVSTKDVDHLWVRILDVKKCLETRTYAARGQITIAVTDPLGFAEGSWTLDVDATGSAGVTEARGPADVTMTVNELGSIYLGGVPARTLAQAGRVTGDAARLDEMFRSAVAPWLSIWF